MARKRDEAPLFEYYEAAALGPHPFFARALEYCLTALSAKTGEALGYHAFLPRALDDIEAVAGDMGGRSVDWLMEPFPLGGLSFMKESPSRRRPRVLQGKRDVVYCFKDVCKHPVYVGTIGIITHDYGRPAGVYMSFIIARDNAEADVFINKFFEKRRERNRNGCILNFMGEPISEFREMQWGQIFLDGNMLQQIRDEISSFFANKRMYQEHGLDWRRGMLLAGPPGNGKTAICRAIATSAKFPIVYCAINDGDMLGVLNNASVTIGQNAPCIAIFEDADAVGVDDAVRAAMLNMLDGLFTCDGVFTLATTNCPDKLDNAFTSRPSRFDSYYVVDNPKEPERRSILMHRLGKKGVSLPAKEVDALVGRMEGLSAACVQEIAACSLLAALKTGKALNAGMLAESLAKVKAHMKASKDGSDKWGHGSVGFGAVADSSPDDDL